MYAGLLVGGRKKSNFTGFLGANLWKINRFRGNFGDKLSRKSIGKKKADFVVIFGKTLLEIDQVCADHRPAFLMFF